MSYNPSPYLSARARKMKQQEQEEDTKYYRYLIQKIRSTDPKLLNNFDKREYEDCYNYSKIFKYMADEYADGKPPSVEDRQSPIAAYEPRFHSETPYRNSEILHYSSYITDSSLKDSKSRPASTEQKRIQFLEREVEQLNEISKQEAKLKENAVKELQRLRERNEQLEMQNAELLKEISVLKAKFDNADLDKSGSQQSDGRSDDLEAGDLPPDSIPNELLEQFDFE